MRMRYLGRSGLSVSALAFGTMTFGNEADEAQAGRLFACARDAGINLFDTANGYAKGRSEEILGRLIRGSRDQLVVATKAAFPTGPGPNDCGASRAHLVAACEASLRRLATDRIDLFYVHRFDPRTALEETLRALEQLVVQGKIIYPAVSNFAAYQTQRALDLAAVRGLAPLAAIQPMYNLLKRQAESEILPMAQDNGLGVLPYSPLAAGLLTGKYQQQGADGRMRTNRVYQKRYERSSQLACERFVTLAKERGVAPAALAVAWVARHPAVTAPILGARSVEQLAPQLAAADLTLDDDLYAAISALTPPGPSATDRDEEGTEHDMWSR